MRAGKLRDRVTFERFTSATSRTNTAGGEKSWSEICKRNANVRFDRDGEKVETGRQRQFVTGVLIVRSDSVTRTITNADRVVFDGAPHQIRSATNPDRRNREVHIRFERGAVT